MRTPTLTKAIAYILLIESGSVWLQAQDPAKRVGVNLSMTSQRSEALQSQDVPQIAPENSKENRARTVLGPADQNFLRSALVELSAESAIGKLALQQGSEATKELARELIRSQAKNSAALQGIARTKGMVLITPFRLPLEKSLQDLEEKGGTEFDLAVRDLIAQQREKCLLTFAHGARVTRDASVRALASQLYWEVRNERPLATAAAAESAQNSLEIVRVALNPKAAMLAQQQAEAQSSAPSPATQSTATREFASPSADAGDAPTPTAWARKADGQWVRVPVSAIAKSSSSDMKLEGQPVTRIAVRFPVANGRLGSGSTPFPSLINDQNAGTAHASLLRPATSPIRVR